MAVPSLPRALDLDHVTSLLLETVAEDILPRFGSLAADQITAKPTEGDPEDVVSEVDEAVEARLTRALLLLLPGSVVVGEEAAAVTPSLLGGTADGGAGLAHRSHRRHEELRTRRRRIRRDDRARHLRPNTRGVDRAAGA
jgi:hypothetical protein